MVLGRAKCSSSIVAKWKAEYLGMGMGTCRNESFWQFSNCLFPQQVKQRTVEKSLRVLREKKRKY